MENPEEILHSLEEFSKLRPKDIPRELEEYLCFVAKTGDPVYQWSEVKSLFREKLINVITEFYESCPSVEIPPCRNVDLFNYEAMKNFILEKLDTFAAAPFTVQRICELLTTPRKEYNRIDKYMRALEKNILVVSTTEPGGGRRNNHENADGIVNGLESEHAPEPNISNNDINVEEMDDMPSWPRITQQDANYQNNDNGITVEPQTSHTAAENSTESFSVEPQTSEATCSSTPDSSLTCSSSEQQPYVSIEPVVSDNCLRQEDVNKSERVSVTITAIPTGIQKRRNSTEPVVPAESTTTTVAVEPSPESGSIETLDKDITSTEIPPTQEQIENADSTSPAQEELKEIESKNEPTEEEAQPTITESTTTCEVDDKEDKQEDSNNAETVQCESTVDAGVQETEAISSSEKEEKPVEVTEESKIEHTEDETESVDVKITSSTEEVKDEVSTSEEKIDGSEANVATIAEKEETTTTEEKEVSVPEESSISEVETETPSVTSQTEEAENSEKPTPMEVDVDEKIEENEETQAVESTVENPPESVP